MSRKSLRIRGGRGLLANGNPASTRKKTAYCRSVYNRPMRGHYGVDRHWWPRIRAPSAHNGLRIGRRFAFDV